MYSKAPQLKDRSHKQSKHTVLIKFQQSSHSPGSKFARGDTAKCLKSRSQVTFSLFSQQRRCNKDFIVVTKAIAQMVNKISAKYSLL